MSGPWVWLGSHHLWNQRGVVGHDAFGEIDSGSAQDVFEGVVHWRKG